MVCKIIVLKDSQNFKENTCIGYTLFYKQPVYNQLALGWQIAKQLSGLNPVSLSNNENYRLRKSGVFPLQRKIDLKPTTHQKSAVSSIIGKSSKSLFINIDFKSWKLLYSSQT